MKKLLLSITGASLFTGCLSTYYEAPDGTVMSRRAFGTLTDFQLLEAEAKDRKIKIEGYKSDQVQAIGAVAEGVAKGLKTGAP